GGKRPQGEAFFAACKNLCERAGVPYPERGLSEEEKGAARKQDERRAVLEDAAAFCEQTLWSPLGEKALAYLRDGRGLTDEEVRLLRLGLYLSAKDLLAYLMARGHAEEACKGAGVLWRRMEGFIVIPWADERGRPLTIYGRWQEKEPPLMRDTLAWRAKR